jgi:O-antigen/teichoic acid export membrane protein
LYWGNILLATFSLSILFILLLSLIGPHISHSYSLKLILAVAISECLCRQLALCSATVFQAFEQLRLTAIVNLLTNVMRLITVALLVHFLHKTDAAVWANATLLVSFVAAVIAVSLVTSRFGKPLLSARLAAARAAEGFLYAVSYSTQSVYNDFDKTMLGHYGMNEANGIYSMAYRFVDIASMPVNAVQAATAPRFFKHGAGGVSATKQFAQRIVRRTSIVGLFASTALFLLAPIVPHVLGSSFAETGYAMRWLCLLPLLRSFHSSAGDALSGAGRAGVRLMSQLGAGLFNFGVNLYLIPHYSWRGAAWSSIATDGLLVVANWFLVFKLAE